MKNDLENMNNIDKLNNILTELNHEYGQDNPIKNIKSLDYNNIHFEFGDILGVAIYKESNEFRFVIIKEVDNFWFVPDRTINIDAKWLESFRKVISRANNYVKLLKATNI